MFLPLLVLRAHCERSLVVMAQFRVPTAVNFSMISLHGQCVTYAKFGGGGLAPRHRYDVCVRHTLICVDNVV